MISFKTAFLSPTSNIYLDLLFKIISKYFFSSPSIAIMKISDNLICAFSSLLT